MYLIALKMLFGDKMKFITLVAAMTFSTVLMMQQGSIFVGLLRNFSTTVRVTQAPIWVMQKATRLVDVPDPMPETYLGQVRSMDGVEWAVPFLLNRVKVRLPDGGHKYVQLQGVDGASLVGLPQNALSGTLTDINTPEAIVLDQNELDAMGNPKVGDVFEINDNSSRLVAIVEMPKNTFSYPIIYSTYDRAKEISPPERKFLSFILVKPQEGYTDEQVIKSIQENTDLIAFTQKQFFWKTIKWYLDNTGIPVNFGIAVALGIIVGAAVASQTFYTFTLENLRHLATLKAVGVKNRTITKMVLLQSGVVGFLGFGIGLLITVIFGSTIPKFTKLAFYTPYQLLFLSFFGVVGLCAFSSVFSLNKIRKLEPAIVFRG
ncbi:MAG: ABC transporter permease, partial [Vampirovibrionia bacterium]